VPKKLILVVIDGLTPAALEHAIESGRAPTIARLAEEGTYRRAVSTFPSLTPVCLSSLATGGHSDVHEIPHLVWYHRGERRIVEYGSSFAAIRAAGFGRSVRDAIVEMNRSHLSPRAVTLFEALEDAGLTAAAINFTCYRGRNRHRAVLPGFPAASGPKRFFYFNLYESDPTGAPLAVRNRAAGTVDDYASAVARWLVTRDGFDLLVHYLQDVDFASHLHGPDAAEEALERSDHAVSVLIEAAGGLDELLERYALVLCADHGQTRVGEVARLREPFAAFGDVLVTGSNRAGMVYRLPGCGADARELATRLDGFVGADVVLFREGGEAVARREGEELRFRPDDTTSVAAMKTVPSAWVTSGDASLLDDCPDALERSWTALHNPNAGEVLVSAASGFEFADLAGRYHAGGGSHGSLLAGDSEVPMLTVGLDAEPRSIVDVAPVVLDHFGVEPPPYARALAAHAT
jgi:Type I phosphodiesterase / nucleotide pyrophosphatase